MGKKKQCGHTVIVLDSKGLRVTNCHPPRARILVSKGKAVVIATSPFTIQLGEQAASPRK